MSAQSMDVAALLEEQEAIVLQRLKQEQEQTRPKQDSTSDTRASARPRDRERDRERSDDAHPRRRERDHYDGRRADPRLSTDRYLSEREENDQRRSRRSREIVDDTDVRHASDRDSANGSVRSRPRSRSPRPASRRSDGRAYRARSRSRTLSPRRYSHADTYPARHHRASDDHRRDDRRSDRPDDRRGPSRRDDAGRRHGRRTDSFRASRVSPEARRGTPDPTDDERDRRTVFVQQLAARLKPKELRRFFEQVGAVIDAQIVTDRVSGRSKGVGYVEFKEEGSVDSAIGLTGQKLLGIPIIVQLTEAEKNRQARDRESTNSRNNTQPQTRLYVGNIQFNITEEDLQGVFAPWGDLVNVSLQKDETNRSKGYAFVEYSNAESAKAALEAMNNFKLGDRAIRVGRGGDRNSNFPDADRSANANLRGPNYQGSSFSGMGGRGSHAGGSGNFDRAGGRDTDKAGGASALDDVDMDGVNFSNYSRDALMRKLARQDEPSQSVAPKAEQRKVTVEEPTATRCILMKNVYDQNTETEPNWQKVITDDIAGECNKKYGKVVHIALALENNDGEVYVKFDTVKGGENAYKSLQGRLFDGRRINAQYVVDVVYNSLYPKAANV